MPDRVAIPSSVLRQIRRGLDLYDAGMTTAITETTVIRARRLDFLGTATMLDIHAMRAYLDSLGQPVPPGALRVTPFDVAYALAGGGPADRWTSTILNSTEGLAT